jgi:Peptidoglycan-synthase activator LpoB
MNNKQGMVLVGLLSSLALGAGCFHDKPHEYGNERPPVTELDHRDAGLQSKDVVQATDAMAMSLLGDSAFNVSKDQWTIVVGNIRNESVNSREALDIFLERLRTQLFKHGKGRITLIQNKATYHDRQAGELEIDTAPYGGQPGPKGVQPDFQLDGVVSELPNRGTSYYYMSFSVNNLRDRTVAWTDAYEVRVAR